MSTVTWKVESGDVVLSVVDDGTETTQMLNGISSISPVSGTTAGTYVVSWSMDINGVPVTGTITGTINPGPMAGVVVLSGDNQLGIVGQPLQPFMLEGVDEFGNPLSDFLTQQISGLIGMPSA